MQLRYNNVLVATGIKYHLNYKGVINEATFKFYRRNHRTDLLGWIKSIEVGEVLAVKFEDYEALSKTILKLNNRNMFNEKLSLQQFQATLYITIENDVVGREMLDSIRKQNEHNFVTN